MRKFLESKTVVVQTFPKVKFAYLNKANLLVMKDLRAGYRDEAAFLQAVTNAASSLSGQLGFNAVVTEAVWVDANINITNLIVDKLRGISIDYSFNKNKFNVVKNIGFVNVNFLLTDAPLAHKAKNKLESEFSKRDKDIRSLITDVKNMVNKFEVDSSTLNNFQMVKHQDMVKSRKDLLERYQREFQEDLNTRRNEELSKVINIANKVVADIAESTNYGIIFQEAVYVESGLDLTSKLIKHRTLQ